MRVDFVQCRRAIYNIIYCTPLLPHSPIYSPTASSKISLHLTLLPSLAHSKKAPLNFRWRLYVSSGGGASLSLIMSGICSLTRSVTVCWLKS